jgi:hypothetical protein
VLSVARDTARATLRFAPAREAIVSWNARAPHGSLELRAERADGATSGWLPYARWNERERRSLGGADAVATIAIDVVRASAPLVAIEVRSDAPLETLAVATPPAGEPRPRTNAAPRIIDVPQRSQYDPAHPGERGWCSPASLSMVLAHFGYERSVAELAAAVRDEAYGGTGNWAFNVAAAGALGLSAAVVYLRDLVAAEHFTSEGFPLVLSFAWKSGGLPDAPLDASDGHLAVLCGFDEDGDAVCNDPAQASLRATYPREAFERVWLGHGGVAYAIVPPQARERLTVLASA